VFCVWHALCVSDAICSSCGTVCGSDLLWNAPQCYDSDSFLMAKTSTSGMQRYASTAWSVQACAGKFATASLCDAFHSWQCRSDVRLDGWTVPSSLTLETDTLSSSLFSLLFLKGKESDFHEIQQCGHATEGDLTQHIIIPQFHPIQNGGRPNFWGGYRTFTSRRGILKCCVLSGQFLWK
jgi:hypothetical protein